MNKKELEYYWNNKHPQAEIIYGGRQIPKREGRVPIDVRKMVWSTDYMLWNIIQNEKLNNDTNDETALLCQKYIVNNYKYENDINSVGYNEYWQFPNETIYLKVGDCEDGSILLASLMSSAGIPEWRIRVNAGYALDNMGVKQGHAYVTYCRESDNNWVILDWCYNQDSNIIIEDKILAKDNGNYSDIWFSFNNLFSFSYKRYDIFEDINEEPPILFDNV